MNKDISRYARERERRLRYRDERNIWVDSPWGSAVEGKERKERLPTTARSAKGLLYVHVSSRRWAQTTSLKASIYFIFLLNSRFRRGRRFLSFCTEYFFSFSPFPVRSKFQECGESWLVVTLILAGRRKEVNVGKIEVIAALASCGLEAIDSSSDQSSLTATFRDQSASGCRGGNHTNRKL